ncbi:MAG: DinB family protein [Phycisphaerales bacterium]
MSKAAALLAEFEAELKTTRKFLERLPSDRLAWRPHEKSMTAGQLGLHIAQVPKMVLDLSMPDEKEPADFNRPQDQPANVAAILSALDQSAQFVRETLPTIGDHRMSQIFKVISGDKTLFAAPREMFLRSIMLNHWYHHRGQLGVYLRLLGAKVPSSYGPSGDESPF